MEEHEQHQKEDRGRSISKERIEWSKKEMRGDVVD